MKRLQDTLFFWTHGLDLPTAWNKSRMYCAKNTPGWAVYCWLAAVIVAFAMACVIAARSA